MLSAKCAGGTHGPVLAHSVGRSRVVVAVALGAGARSVSGDAFGFSARAGSAGVSRWDCAVSARARGVLPAQPIRASGAHTTMNLMVVSSRNGRTTPRATQQHGHRGREIRRRHIRRREIGFSNNAWA